MSLGRALIAGLLAAGVLGCGGGGGDDADRDPIEVAMAWVNALNERDYERACELSVTASSSEPPCEELLKASSGDRKLELVEGAYFNRSEQQPAFGSFSATPEGGGPPVTFMVEEHGGRFLVHFEVSVIR